MNKNPEINRLFIDMDGTLAVFHPISNIERLYEKDYFLKLEPMQNVIAAIKLLKKEHPELPVRIVSATLSDSRYALEEKNFWLDKYLPEIRREERIFLPCGEGKKHYIEGGIGKRDFLIDDYTKNLLEWEPHGRGIKLLNGINHTRKTWNGNRLSALRPAESMAAAIMAVMEGEVVQDNNPRHYCRNPPPPEPQP